jgi:hypothetical protein
MGPSLPLTRTCGADTGLGNTADVDQVCPPGPRPPPVSRACLRVLWSFRAGSGAHDARGAMLHRGATHTGAMAAWSSRAPLRLRASPSQLRTTRHVPHLASVKRTAPSQSVAVSQSQIVAWLQSSAQRTLRSCLTSAARVRRRHNPAHGRQARHVAGRPARPLPRACTLTRHVRAGSG